MNFITSITLAIAVLGAVLGIINTIHSLNRDRILLKIIPKWIIVPSGRYLGIEIVNLSYIAVVVEEVGFSLTRTIKGERIPLLNPVVLDGGPFPRRLEPRYSMTVVASKELLKSKEFRRIKFAYAGTSCGLIFKGNSGALRQAVHDCRMKDKGSNV